MITMFLGFMIMYGIMFTLATPVLIWKIITEGIPLLWNWLISLF